MNATGEGVDAGASPLKPTVTRGWPDDDDGDATEADERRRSARAELWEDWWFEARNPSALELLASMPGADVDARTKWRHLRETREVDPGGMTAAMLAAERDDPESIVALTAMGADLNVRDGGEATALHHAAHRNAARAAVALLDQGADPNAQRPDGSTAAILAAYGTQRDVLNVLIDRHPDVDLTLRDGGNATVAGHCAQRGLRNELLAILKKCGPGGAGRLRRGEKVYLAKKRELTEQLEILPAEMLAELAKSWRARPLAGDDKKALIVKLLQQTP